MTQKIKLFGFWRSIATYRVRIGLSLKGQAFEESSVDLLKGDQFEQSFRQMNAQANVPVLLFGENMLSQSMAILEYLEEVYPEPALLPTDPLERARIRAFSFITIADTHPLTVPRIRKYLADNFNASDEDIGNWAQNWIRLALDAMEQKLSERTTSTTYCFTDQPSFADIALTAQTRAAGVFDLKLDQWPLVSAIEQKCLELDAFSRHTPQKMFAALQN